MTVAELIEKLIDFDGSEEITFYYLKDNILTNSRLEDINSCLLYTSPSPRDRSVSRMPSSA